MFIYGKEAMEIVKDEALKEITEVIWGWDGSTAEEKVHTVTGIIMLLDSLGNRFADEEENNDAT